MRDVGARDALIVEIDFGGPPSSVSKVVTVTDSRITATSNVLMQQSGIAATGRQSDENEFDAFFCRCTPAAGSFTAYVASQFGPVMGKYKFSYVVR